MVGHVQDIETETLQPARDLGEFGCRPDRVQAHAEAKLLVHRLPPQPAQPSVGFCGQRAGRDGGDAGAGRGVAGGAGAGDRASLLADSTGCAAGKTHLPDKISFSGW
nr:hypothetical protein CPGR_00232 [Mycolicibacter nonchromogenicus]